MITIVDNESKYWDFIRTLRNDPRVREGFVKISYITHEQQNEYMEKTSLCFGNRRPSS